MVRTVPSVFPAATVNWPPCAPVSLRHQKCNMFTCAMCHVSGDKPFWIKQFKFVFLGILCDRDKHFRDTDEQFHEGAQHFNNGAAAAGSRIHCS